MNAKNTVKLRLDPDKPASPAQRKRLAAVASMPDSDIDYSDIPRKTAGVRWTRPGALLPSGNKQQITLRLDSDVLGFFKGTGQRYQSRINAVLREYMNAHRKTG